MRFFHVPDVFRTFASRNSVGGRRVVFKTITFMPTLFSLFPVWKQVIVDDIKKKKRNERFAIHRRNAKTMCIIPLIIGRVRLGRRSVRSGGLTVRPDRPRPTGALTVEGDEKICYCKKNKTNSYFYESIHFPWKWKIISDISNRNFLHLSNN